jgi:protein TonB
LYGRAFYCKHVRDGYIAPRGSRIHQTKTIMEPKKNPKYDIHRNRGVLLNVSLAISLMLVITAFEWSVNNSKKEMRKPADRNDRIEMASIPIVHHKRNDVVAPKPLEIEKPKSSLESINFKAVDDNHPVEEPKTGAIDQSNSPMTEVMLGAIELPEENTETVFRIVEKMPEPVGGWETFVKTLRKHMKYPRRAERASVAGKVFVSFTVNEKGELQDFSIERGIGFGCDEEAMRVIALTKWNPGKQRGRAVKVRMVQPINFSITTP